MNILAFFAHPDDETMMCGATLAMAAEHADVYLLCATRGEGGENGEPPLCERVELGAFRSAELQCASQALGARELVFLEYVDPTIGPQDTLYPFTENEDHLAQEVVEAIQRVRADVLISHGTNGEYGHPAHKLCHRAALQAIQRLGPQAPLFYTPHAIFPQHPYPRLANQDDPAHLIADLEAFRASKTAAALCHRTQHALFIRRPSQTLGREVTVPEVIQTLESFHRAYPPLAPGQALEDAFASLLRAHGAARENPNWHLPGNVPARD